MTARGYRRRRYLVHKIQKKYVVITTFLLIIYTALIALFLFIPPALKLVSDVSLVEKEEAATRFLLMAEHLWPAIILSIVIMAFVSIFITHRLAGPLYRFEAMAQRIIAGDLSAGIHLRGKDDMARFADLFNQAIDNINGALVEMRDAEREMAKALTRMRSDPAVKGMKSLHEDIEVLVMERAKIATVLERFDRSGRV
ncbi:MAG: hypothetical protein ACE5D4_09765 [Thermodesulfobacteriota bacterium]